MIIALDPQGIIAKLALHFLQTRPLRESLKASFIQAEFIYEP
jgi:hypothetical protein